MCFLNYSFIQEKKETNLISRFEFILFLVMFSIRVTRIISFFLNSGFDRRYGTCTDSRPQANGHSLYKCNIYLIST